MSKNNLSKIVFMLILFTLVTLIVNSQATQSGPRLPAFFYGKATVNGRDVPVGSLIIAKIDEQKAGEIDIVTAGQYGEAVGDQDLGVVGTNNGDIIEFYLKLPGYEEIKAAQTIEWISGSQTELDLSFNGEEIEEQDSNEENEEEPGEEGTPGSLVGSSGGSSGAGGPTTSNKASFYYTTILGGRQFDIPIYNKNIPITRLQLIVLEKIQNVSFDLEVVSNPGVTLLNKVYKYVSINAPKITEDNVNIIIIRFHVPNYWITQNNIDPKTIKLYRYSNSNAWVELDTVFEGSDASYHEFRAQTPGFSYFAISASSSEEEPVETIEPEEVQETVENIDVAQDKTPEGESKGNEITGMVITEQKRGSEIVTIVLALLLGMAISYIIVDKIKK